MKVIMLLLVLLGVTSAKAQKTYTKRLTKDEKKFVNCVLKYEKEKVINVTKRKDSHIVLEFPSTIYVLNPSGYVDEVWILGDGDWISLGTEKDAY
jgi:hypothetical protein